MSFKSPSSQILNYTIYAVISTILELAIFLAIAFWGLPYIGINLPLWAIIIIAIVLLSYSYYTYIMGKRTLTKKLMHALEAMIGMEGIVAKTLDPLGHVKIRNEIWKATSDSRIEAGEKVIVVDADRLTLHVKRIE